MEGPGRALLHCLIDVAAGNHWCSGIEDGDFLTERGIAAAIVGSCWSIEGPGRALLHCLIGVAAGNHRCSSIQDADLLTARTLVAASIGSLPGARRIKGGAAMATDIGHGAKNRNGIA